MFTKLFVFLLGVCVAFAAINTDPLFWNSDGTFKVVQFTDEHIQDCNVNDTKTVQLMESILMAEKPDLVILTGDQISGWLLKKPSKPSWEMAVSPMIKLGFRYTWIFGNHDHQGDLNRTQLLDLDHSLSDLSMTQRGPLDVHGVSNYYLFIRDKTTNKPEHVMWFLDSHDKSHDSHLSGMDWVRQDQVNWYYAESVSLERQYGKLRGSMYFHIPTREYESQWFCRTSYGHMDDFDIGVSFMNGGLIAAAQERGDVDNTFCGHAHMCDFRGVYYGGIQLAFGRSTGFSGYGTLMKGARVIQFYRGERNIKTWLRLADGSVEYTQPTHEPEDGRCYFKPYQQHS